MICQEKKHIPSITMLRGLACLAVCFFHFSGTVDSVALHKVASYGGYGVPIFFAISGFILPYSLSRAEYQVRNYFKFIIKRIIRLEPAYIVSIVLVFLLSAIAQFSKFNTSEPIEVINTRTFLHFFYLVDIFNDKWLNPVYWTLAIEFQFYLLIGLVFYFLKSKNIFVLLSVFLLLNLSSLFVYDDRFLPYYFLMFLPGIILFWYQSQKITLMMFLSFVVIVAAASFYKYGVSGAICTIIPILFIQFVTKPIKPLVFLGTISYSLYLIHTIIGTDGIINFMQNYITDANGRIWLMILSFPVVLFIAWLYYIVIERPSIVLSKKIKYKTVANKT